MFRTICRELNYIVNHVKPIGFSAFLCCFSGILLWVNGGELRYFIRQGRIAYLPLTGIFLIWLTVYGLCGIVLSLLLLNGGRNRHALPAFSVCCAVYLLTLIWYAVFFCTRLYLFSFLLLLLCLFLTVLLFRLTGRIFLLIRVILFLIFAAESYFLYFNLTFYLGFTG